MYAAACYSSPASQPKPSCGALALFNTRTGSLQRTSARLYTPPLPSLLSTISHLSLFFLRHGFLQDLPIPLRLPPAPPPRRVVGHSSSSSPRACACACAGCPHYPRRRESVPGAMRGAMREALAAEPLPPRVSDLLPAVPLRATGHRREPRAVRALLHQHEDPPQRHQMPLITTRHIYYHFHL